MKTFQKLVPILIIICSLAIDITMLSSHIEKFSQTQLNKLRMHSIGALSGALVVLSAMIGALFY